MLHKPLQIKDFNLSFSHKICFENFTCQINYGSRIAIIGRNGSGKSSLLKMIASICGEDVVVGYVPQVIVEYKDLSGGQRLNKAITEALSLNPNILLLDEPTNHLNYHNRKSFMRMLQNYLGTLIIVSHDKELLRKCSDTLWHIDKGKVNIFSGNYDDYISEIKLKRTAIEDELELLNLQKKDIHNKLMQEQQRAAKSKAKGEKKVENAKLLKMVGNLKAMQAEKSQGKKLKNINETKNDLKNKLSILYLSEVIVPTFSIESAYVGRGRVLQISEASIGYFEGKPLLSNISLSLQSGERIAIKGNNGSGKSTLIKAILKDESVYKTGQWHVIGFEDIGYLDQHYGTLNLGNTVLESIVELVPNWSYVEVRSHLNDFLFRKNEEVNALVGTLSGGEKARLSLALIAAKTPKLLILDEITNNLDLETKEHVIQVLRAYLGAMIVISHDDDFLEEIGVNYVVDIEKFKD